MIVRALQPFGAEITGVALDAVAPADVPALQRLIAVNRVVVFPAQAITDAALVQFLALFGPLTFTAGETPVAAEPQLNLVSNVGRTTPPRSVFHTDTSYVRRPPALTALRAVRVPAAGGCTLFSDQVAAAARLPGPVRAALGGRTVLHSLGSDPADGARHPLFRQHPLTAESALYLSTPARLSAISGVDERTSARLVAALYWHSIRRSLLYRHAWRPGDVVVWDNRVTMHKADHHGVAGDRILHRGLVLGEVPIAAAAA